MQYALIFFDVQLILAQMGRGGDVIVTASEAIVISGRGFFGEFFPRVFPPGCSVPVTVLGMVAGFCSPPLPCASTRGASSRPSPQGLAVRATSRSRRGR